MTAHDEFYKQHFAGLSPEAKASALDQKMTATAFREAGRLGITFDESKDNWTEWRDRMISSAAVGTTHLVQMGIPEN